MRAALFRFVDVVPACRSLDDLARHLSGFLEEVGDRPPSLQVAMRMSESKAGRQALGAAAAAGVKHMAHRFIVGETPREATGVLEDLWRKGVATSVDLLGEATDHHRRGRPLRRALPRGARRPRRGLPQAPRAPGARGRQRRAHPAREPVGQGLRPHAAAARRRARARQARRRRAPARPAAPRRASSTRTCTSTWSPSTRARRSPTSCSSCSPRTSSATGRRPGSCCRPTCATAPSCASGSSPGRRRRRAATRCSCAWSRAPTGTTRSSRPASTAGSRRCSRSRPTPIATSRRSRARLLEARPAVRVAIASHNLRSIAHAVAANRALGRRRPRPRVPGPARPRRRPAGRAGQARPARAHVLPGRRPGRRHGLPRAPAAREHEQRVLPARAGGGPLARRAARRAMTDLPTFVNEPIGELRRASVRDELLAGMAALEPTLPLRVPVWIGDGERHDDALQSRPIPAHPERVVGHHGARHRGRGRRGRRRPPRAASRAGRRRPRPSAPRSSSRAAAWMRERRAELAALEVRECAKPWDEADADVCEAIDFLEFYARGAVALDRGKALFQVPGERNEMRYAPRGVVAVIAPWNFPLAIPMGMTAAGLATGNAVVLKPAEQAPGCGLMVVRALREAGVPADALALLPGEGEAGAALVAPPRRAHDRLHRLGPGRPGDHPRRRRARRAPPQARRGRDGRQELRDRRLRRRPRRRRPRDRLERVRLRRAEVLGGLARARPRGDRRRAARARRRRGRGAASSARPTPSASTCRR